MGDDGAFDVDKAMRDGFDRYAEPIIEPYSLSGKMKSISKPKLSVDISVADLLIDNNDDDLLDDDELKLDNMDDDGFGDDEPPEPTIKTPQDKLNEAGLFDLIELLIRKLVNTGIFYEMLGNFGMMMQKNDVDITNILLNPNIHKYDDPKNKLFTKKNKMCDKLKYDIYDQKFLSIFRRILIRRLMVMGSPQLRSLFVKFNIICSIHDAMI